MKREGEAQASISIQSAFQRLSWGRGWGGGRKPGTQLQRGPETLLDVPGVWEHSHQFGRGQVKDG